MFIYLISYFLIRVFFAEDFTLIFNFPPGAFLPGFNKKKVIKIQIVENVKEFISEKVEENKERKLCLKNMTEKRKALRKIEGMGPTAMFIGLALALVCYTVLGLFEVVHFVYPTDTYRLLDVWRYRYVTIYGYIWIILLISAGVSFLIWFSSEMKLNNIYARIYGLHPLGSTRRYYRCAECDAYQYEYELKYDPGSTYFSCSKCGHFVLTKHSGAKPN